ncbi:hypothetical protein [Mycobacterium sp. 852002-51961_SCH5331710]|uniref:hypothetical protein n=1 Tax=Mycobacterium sp. 852002-51961_SCH5331710 TaxID=1834105 RepID=UPI0008006157|nr:hypothetical protein [Mycobacterium sp. 852002-51961_SCH5331710]OBB37294.1 hypothetical protein A5752_14770 [Mycobacterium sp. 852002-51961_SCH5331710]
MVGLGVALLVLAAVAILTGLVFYGNGAGTVPDRPMRDTTATRRGLSRIDWSALFSTMKTSVKGATDGDADRRQRMASLGAFFVLAGLILVVLAILAFIVAMV